MRKRHHRRKLSMTSLIDVIFLLLLFFMLSSTFSHFAEVELGAAASGAGGAAQAKPAFLRLGADSLSLNGRDVALETLDAELTAIRTDTGLPPLLVSLRAGVTAQRLTDLLVTLRRAGGGDVTVLEAM